MWLVAAVTFGSGLVVAVRMRETLRPHDADGEPKLERVMHGA
jgi:hypothetical protein